MGPAKPRSTVRRSTSSSSSPAAVRKQYDSTRLAQPTRMGLTYVGADGAEHMPFCIHRAPFSTHERMVAFARTFRRCFRRGSRRCRCRSLPSEHYEAANCKMSICATSSFVRNSRHKAKPCRKIREGTTRKIPQLLIVGEREQADGTVTLRRWPYRTDYDDDHVRSGARTRRQAHEL